jgi:hypothetical protein
MNEIGNIEKFVLSKIDLEKGPDNIQINLAIKLNIFKIFSLKVRQKLKLLFSEDIELVLFNNGRVFWSIESVQ